MFSILFQNFSQFQISGVKHHRPNYPSSLSLIDGRQPTYKKNVLFTLACSSMDIHFEDTIAISLLKFGKELRLSFVAFIGSICKQP